MCVGGSGTDDLPGCTLEWKRPDGGQETALGCANLLVPGASFHTQREASGSTRGRPRGNCALRSFFGGSESVLEVLPPH